MVAAAAGLGGTSVSFIHHLAPSAAVMATEAPRVTAMSDPALTLLIVCVVCRSVCVSVK